ncbi:predicted protein, partial [Arabidopsis lyrata subsp. lyrata]
LETTRELHTEEAHLAPNGAHIPKKLKVQIEDYQTGWRMREYERQGNAFQRLVVVYLLYKTTLDQTLLDDQQHVQQENEVHAHGNVVGVDDVVDQEVEHHQIDRDVVEQIVNNQQQGNDVHAHGNMVGIDDLVDQEVGHHQFHGEQIVNNQAHGIVDDWDDVFDHLGDF